MASTTRNLVHSLEYRLYQILYQDGWVVTEEKLPMVPSAGDRPANSYTIATQRPWVFWDANAKNPSRNHITLYRNGVPVGPSNYIVNFAGGFLTLKTALVGDFTLDVSYFSAKVMEGYPEEKDLEMIDLPIVAYSVEGKDGKPFAIGTSASDYTYPVTIDILARTHAEIQDMMDGIVERIKFMPLIDCSGAWVTGTTGDVNSNFNFDLQFEHNLIVGRHPRGTLLAPRRNGSDKEKHRAIVTVGFKKVS